MKIGFFLKDIGNNQIAFDLITEINKYLKTNKDDAITIFVENIESPVKTPSCPVMQATEVWSYTGNVVATSVSTATKLIQAVSPKRKMMLVHSPEWFNQQNIVRYEGIHQVFMFPRLEILTIDETYNKLFLACFNREPSLVWKDFSIKQLVEHLNNERAKQ